MHLEGDRVISEDENLLIVAAVCNDPFMAIGELKTCLKIRASKTSVGERLHECGIQS